MDLAALRVFRAVAEEGSVTRAAERLHTVQSNVTTRIRQLEELLDIALFDRINRRLVITPAGRLLLDYAERLLVLAEEAREAIRAFDTDTILENHERRYARYSSSVEEVNLKP